MADLERALELLEQEDKSELKFSPESKVSPNIYELTGLEEYPTENHLENLGARIIAVSKAGDKLVSRAASNYVSKLIVACARLAPPSD